MKKLTVLCALSLSILFSATVNAETPNAELAEALEYANSLKPTVEKVEAAAMKGDYQAQRNLAYGYVQWPYKGQEKNPIMGCAWYIIILESGSPKVHSGDVGNFKVHCGQLEEVMQRAAIAQARKLYKKIYKEKASF